MTISDTYLIDLLSQHSLESDDLNLICELSAVDNAVSKVENWSFEQFFGLTVYMFVTTESAPIRRQLARIIPKFGSRAVLSLIKIVHQTELSAELQLLARQGLDQISHYGLAHGLSQVLATDSPYEPFVLKTLATLAQELDEPILLLVSQLLAPSRWRVLEARLLEWLPVDEALSFDETTIVGNEPAKDAALHNTMKTRVYAA